MCSRSIFPFAWNVRFYGKQKQHIWINVHQSTTLIVVDTCLFSSLCVPFLVTLCIHCRLSVVNRSFSLCKARKLNSRGKNVSFDRFDHSFIYANVQFLCLRLCLYANVIIIMYIGQDSFISICQCQWLSNPILLSDEHEHIFITIPLAKSRLHVCWWTRNCSISNIKKIHPSFRMKNERPLKKEKEEKINTKIIIRNVFVLIK